MKYIIDMNYFLTRKNVLLKTDVLDICYVCTFSRPKKCVTSAMTF